MLTLPVFIKAFVRSGLHVVRVPADVNFSLREGYLDRRTGELGMYIHGNVAPNGAMAAELSPEQKFEIQSALPEPLKNGFRRGISHHLGISPSLIQQKFLNTLRIGAVCELVWVFPLAGVSDEVSSW